MGMFFKDGRRTSGASHTRKPPMQQINPIPWSKMLPDADGPPRAVAADTPDCQMDSGCEVTASPAVSCFYFTVL